jgi:hypothetical protein
VKLKQKKSRKIYRTFEVVSRKFYWFLYPVKFRIKGYCIIKGFHINREYKKINKTKNNYIFSNVAHSVLDVKTRSKSGLYLAGLIMAV